MQIARLRRHLDRQILPHSPFYREKLRRARFSLGQLRSLDDLRRIPFTTKREIVPTARDPDRPRALVLQPTPESLRRGLPLSAKLRLGGRRILEGPEAVRRSLLREYGPSMLLFTTGRSALPTPFALTRHDLDWMEITGGRILDVLGSRPGEDRGVCLFPYAPHLAFWQVVFCGFSRGLLILSTGGGKAMGTAGILRAMRRIRPTVVIGLPGYTVHVLREALESGMRLETLRHVVLGGEAAPAGLRERIRSLLSSLGASEGRVLSVFGFTEARMCWAECAAGPREGFHTYPDLGIFEVIDPSTREPVGEGEPGELVYTGLAGRGSAILRYRTGDLAMEGIRRDPCACCGRTVPRVGSTIERASSIRSLRSTKIKGTLVNLNVLQRVFAEDPRLEEWQVEIRDREGDPWGGDELWLYVAPRRGVEGEGLGEDLDRRLRETTEVRLNRVLVCSREEMLQRIGMEERLKELRIVDLRSRTRRRAPEAGGDSSAGPPPAARAPGSGGTA